MNICKEKKRDKFNINEEEAQESLENAFDYTEKGFQKGRNSVAYLPIEYSYYQNTAFYLFYGCSE